MNIASARKPDSMVLHRALSTWLDTIQSKILHGRLQGSNWQCSAVSTSDIALISDKSTKPFD